MGNPFEAGRVRANPPEALDIARKSANGDVSAACGIPPILLSGDGDGDSFAGGVQEIRPGDH